MQREKQRSSVYSSLKLNLVSVTSNGIQAPNLNVTSFYKLFLDTTTESCKSIKKLFTEAL